MDEIVQRHFLTRVIVLAAFLGLFFGENPLFAQQDASLQPEDPFSLKEIQGLRLSPNGQEVLFTVRETNLNDDRNVNTLWRISTNGESLPTRLTDSEKDYEPQWSPDGRRVALLSVRDGAPQIFVLNLATGKMEKVTNVPLGISSFKWSPNSKSMVFASSEVNRSSYEQATTAKEKKGVVIDKMTFSFFQLIRNQLFLSLDNPSRLWLYDFASGTSEQLSKDLNVEDYSWSPDGRSLAIAASSGLNNSSRGIFIYSVESRNTKQILQNKKESDLEYYPTYSDPFWSPDGKSVALIYRRPKEAGSSDGSIGIYSLNNDKFSVIETKANLELYNPAFHWIKNEEIYLENTYRANRGLFSLSVKDGTLRRIGETNGYENSFSFSMDGRQTSFVSQSMQTPPEIFIAETPYRTAKKLTSLNQHLARFRLPKTVPIQWLSKDGKQVEGWLFKPLNFEEGKAYPLLVMLHGGPTFVVADRFEPYASDRGGWIWPYPFRLFAARGYAVFVPNYRGTGSYGKSFREYSDEFKEPSDDIISGISFLIQKGIADPKLVGIMGHSHGALLGPSVMAHNRMFKASSFAEGVGNLITSYAYVHGRHNLTEGETRSGGHPYDNPQRYIERSSIFHFKGLNTATLLEFGEQSAAIMGLEILSSLWRQGVPHEMIIYPKAGHNLTSPIQQLESINRNLDWFDYWMLGKRDSSPTKQDQYTRWKKVSDDMKRMREGDQGRSNRTSK